MIIGDHMFTEAKEYAEAAYEEGIIGGSAYDKFDKQICEAEEEFKTLAEKWINISKRLYTYNTK